MFKKIIIVFIILILGLFSLRNHLLKLGLSLYLDRVFDGGCKIKRTSLALGNVTVGGLNCSDTALDLNLGKLAVKLDFKKPLMPAASEVHIHNASITLKSFEKLNAKIIGISERLSKEESTSDTKDKLNLILDLDNIDLESVDADKLDLKMNFSFNGVLGDEGISEIKDISISRCVLGTGVVKIKDLTLTKEKEDIYLLNIPYLKVKDDVISDLKLPLGIAGNKVVIDKTKNHFFGEAGYIEGGMDFSRYQNICVDLDLRDFSFSPTIKVVRPDEDVVLGGLFGGEIKLCFGAGLGDISANLYNNSGGTLDIKKEANLAFLKKYLDQSSYQAVIDNFKNYKYNEGKILIKKEENALGATLYFDSETMGKRDITINFHNIFGGGQ